MEIQTPSDVGPGSPNQDDPNQDDPVRDEYESSGYGLAGPSWPDGVLGKHPQQRYAKVVPAKMSTSDGSCISAAAKGGGIETHQPCRVTWGWVHRLHMGGERFPGTTGTISVEGLAH